MVNTISNYTYNEKERKRLYAIYEAAHKRFEQLCEASVEIDDDAEYEAACVEIDKASVEAQKAYLACFAAQFHKCKNDWFCGIVKQYADDGERRITEKQFDAFRHYACDTDDEHWRSHRYYCRCEDYLVSIRPCGNWYLFEAKKIEEVTI